MNAQTDRRSFLGHVAVIGTGACLVGFPKAARGDAAEFSVADFEKLHKELAPPKDELWRTIPWRMEIVEAAQEAARQKKPLVMRVRSGHPLGCV